MKILLSSILLIFLSLLATEGRAAGSRENLVLLQSINVPGLENNMTYTNYPAMPANLTDFDSSVLKKSATIIRTSEPGASVSRIREKAEKIRQFISQHPGEYNADYCFLADMSVPSGKNRFFVYNLHTDSIEIASLVSHGIGSNGKNNSDAVRFSNDPSSLQTSLGKYKIGVQYRGEYGRSYRLIGLEESNSKAYSRSIVLHSHNQIPECETYPFAIGESFGCPIVSPTILDKLGHYITQAKKPILLWIYNQ